MRIINNYRPIALQWPSMRARILIIKHNFLLRSSITGDLSLSVPELSALTCCLRRWIFAASSTMQIPRIYSRVGLHHICSYIPRQCLSLLNEKGHTAAGPLSTSVRRCLSPLPIIIHKIASSQEGSWPKLWGLALERGVLELLASKLCWNFSPSVSTQTICALFLTVTSHWMPTLSAPISSPTIHSQSTNS